MVQRLDNKSFEYPLSKKRYYRASTRNKITIHKIEYENDQMYPIYCSGDQFKNQIESLLLQNKKIFTMFT